MSITIFPAGTVTQGPERGMEIDSGRMYLHHASNCTLLKVSRRTAQKLSINSSKLSDLAMSVVVVLPSPHGDHSFKEFHML